MRQSAPIRKTSLDPMADAVKGLVLGLLGAVLCGYAPIGVADDIAAHASKVVFVDGGHSATPDPRQSEGDLYIIEEDDITGELIVYVWKDTDDDGTKDQFDVITGVSSELRQIARR